MPRTVRMGVLGAAGAAPAAVIRPARQVTDVTVTAVAARDRARADAFAAKHGIPVVHASYDALLTDPEVDAVYIPLPTAMHANWILAALAAGKHVLCEKPFTANRVEAEKVAAAADSAWQRSRLVVMEAFHYSYHPLTDRLRTIVREELGPLRRVEVSFCYPLFRFSDIRYQYALAGGAMMDAGCYTVHAGRLLTGEDPTVVTANSTPLGADPRIDRAMTVEVHYPSGATGRLRASLLSHTLLSTSAHVTGTEGSLRVSNYVLPHLGHRIRINASGRTRTERVPGESTYTCQLRAFAAAILDRTPVPTSPRDAVVTMGILDDAYRAAGLPIRGLGGLVSTEIQENPELEED
jgi:predicted dehydrogenase